MSLLGILTNNELVSDLFMIYRTLNAIYYFTVNIYGLRTLSTNIYFIPTYLIQ